MDSYAWILGEDIERVEGCLEKSGDWEILRQSLKALNFSALKKKKTEDSPYIDEIKALRDQAKKTARKLAETYGDKGLAAFWKELDGTAAGMRALADLTRALHEAVSQEKKAGSMMDFSDIEHGALALLYDEKTGRTEIARGLQSRFKEILIDEYQDINDIQEFILSLIAGPPPGKRFMVGDVKQSIYGFRMAMPSFFWRSITLIRPDRMRIRDN
jgi:ATP-dependent helicase/nuclease subunit A